MKPLKIEPPLLVVGHPWSFQVRTQFEVVYERGSVTISDRREAKNRYEAQEQGTGASCAASTPEQALVGLATYMTNALEEVRSLLEPLPGWKP